MRSLLLVVGVLIQFVNSTNLLAAEKILDVPYSKQFQAFTCGHESLRMVLAYWGKRESREQILMRLGANGSTPDAIEKVIKTHYRDFRFEPVGHDMASIKKQIDQGRPIMLGAEASNLSYLDYDSTMGHMIILVGYDDTNNLVFIRDPNSPYVEEMPFDAFKAAAFDSPRASFVIYKPNMSPPAGAANNFDKAYPAHAQKDKGLIDISFLIPSMYLSYETEPRLNLSDSYAASSKKANRHFDINWNGLSYGDQTLEQTPWLGNGKSFRTVGFGAAWVIGSRLRLGANELLSPGVYSFGRHRILDVHNFSSIKRIPALLLKKNTIEVTGYQKSEDDESLSYGGLGVEAISWSGARLGWRRGISPVLGHLSAGISAGKVDIKLDGDDSEVYTTGTINYDLNLGIFKGSLQTSELPKSNGTEDKPHDGVSVRAYSVAMDYDLSGIRSPLAPITILNYLGAFRPHIEMTHEIVRRLKNDVKQTITTRRWDVELPVPLHYVDMTYGSGIAQTLLDGGIKDSMRSTWVRFAFDAYQPWVQLTAGYRVTHKDFTKTIGQQMSLGMFAGI